MLTMIIVVWVFVVQVLLVAAYPTGQYDGDSEAVYIDDNILEQVPVQGVAEFSGTVPVSGSVTIVGGCGCLPLLSTSEPSSILPENDDDDETFSLSEITQIGLENEDSDKNDRLSKTALIGSLLADSILAGKEAQIEAKLAEINAFVESELAKTDSLVNSVLTGIDDAVKSDLQQKESEIEIKLEKIEDTIESEPTKTDVLVEFPLENNETPLKLNLAERELGTDMSTKLEELELLVESELAKVDAFVESELKKTEAEIECAVKKVDLLVETKLALNEALVKSELEKVDTFVDSELAITKALIQSELAKVNSLVKSELAKTEALIESELRKLDLFVEPELETVDSIVDSGLEVPVAGVAEFKGVVPASGRAFIYGSTGCNPSSIFNIIEENAAEFEPETKELPIMDNVEFIETVPVTGRTMIFGSTGYLEPNLGPLEANPFIETEEFCENVRVTDQASIIGRSDCAPLFDSVENIPETQELYDDSLAEPFDTDYDIFEPVPVVDDAMFSGVTHASDHEKIVESAGCPSLFPLNPPTVGNSALFIQSQVAPNTEVNGYLGLERKENIPYTEGVLPQINVLPIVNVLKQQTVITEDGDSKEIVIIEGNLEVSGTARATGRTVLFSHFECAPLMPTAETADGQKWLWLAQESSSKATPATVSPTISNAKAPMIEFPISTYPTDFPETIIMDSTKNYERLLNDYGDDSYDEAIPVAGEVYFEGITPAFGSVSIRGHSA